MGQFAPLLPDDDDDRRLLENVDPARAPLATAAPRYNLVVIGAGTAGLVTAAGAAGLGARVALVEGRLMGGDCLNYGCVPSKTLISQARAAFAARRAGIASLTELNADFGSALHRVRRVRADLSAHDSAVRFSGLGVDVFAGQGRFIGPDSIEVGGKVLRFSRAAITTGGRPIAPPIPGLAEAGYLTNETVFSLTEMPQRIAVLGAGPVGCELAQALRRLGVEVTILEMMPRILVREEPDAAARVAQALATDGIRILTGSNIVGVSRVNGAKVVRYEQEGHGGESAADEILIGAGRAANVDGLGLEAAGIAYDAGGVKIDEYLRTSNPRIYAAGDVCTPLRFTHMADAMARILIRNALFHGRAKVSALTIPSCVYTDPEIAHVGIYPADGDARGTRLQTFIQEFSEVDRAVIDDETAGLIKVHVADGTDRILGATIVARHASEMISEVTMAIAHQIGLGAIADIIHPYPTQSEAIRKVADAYNRTRLSPLIKRIFATWFAWNR
jgi:pyruvate/2-oxoglutarate dehydrogenase complex dihydrolipoamide dehydrogenase (E3) component